MYDQVKRSPTYSYPPVGECIYCGETNSLTDEHIVPFALGGNLLLPKASCLECADRTKKYEQRTLRTTLGNLRVRHNFPTRRKKERPSSIEIATVGRNGEIVPTQVPAAEHPFGVPLPHFGRAGVVVGSTPDMDILAHTLKSLYLNGDLDTFKSKYNWDGTYNVPYFPIEFGQMIIKMSYCFAVAELGLKAFTPVCIPQMLSDNINISYVFGQFGMNEQCNGQCPVWHFEISYRSHQSKLWVVVLCSLFPGGGTPIYEVIVGVVDKAPQLQLLGEIIRSGRAVQHPQGAGVTARLPRR